jgi:two-component system sensor histidine kinase MprB
MSFRARLTLIAAIAVAAAVALASAAVYVVVRGELRSQLDDALRDRAAGIAHIHLRGRYDEAGNVVVEIPPVGFGDVPGYVQYVTAEGQVRRPSGYGFRGGHDQQVALPVGAARDVAAGRRDDVLADVRVEGRHMRVITVPTDLPGLAVQVARPLTDVDNALSRIRKVLAGVALGGIALAALLGLAVARTTLAPVRRLTDATEHVSATGDLTSRIDDGGGRDELSRLAGSFNTMLAALEESARAQRQLVADASHELRTPLTSLRTNIEVLARDTEMPRDERERLLADVVEQLAEMTVLVSELVELARGDAHAAEPEDVRLDLLVAEAVDRARRHAPQVEFRAELDESLIHGVPARIDRAVSNLLDNAAKWSPPGGLVEVSVSGGEIVVRDHGPGIDAADLPYVFDRFYRAASARGMPGSGLGLAIVRQVAETHGGVVAAEAAPDGGTVMRLRLGSNGAGLTSST